jgi:hypothetical protein
MRPLLGTDYPNWDTATNDPNIRPVFWVGIDFGSPSHLEATFLYPLTFGTPYGYMTDLKFPKNTVAREKQTFSFTLSGASETLLNRAQSARQDINWVSSGYDIILGFVDIWFFDPNGVLYSDFSYNIAEGLLESCEITEGNEASLITFTFAQSTDWQWDRALIGRWDDAFQKRINFITGGNPYSTDRGFEYVEAIQSWELFWAKPKPAKKHRKKHKKGKNRGKDSA